MGYKYPLGNQSLTDMINLKQLYNLLPSISIEVINFFAKNKVYLNKMAIFFLYSGL